MSQIRRRRLGYYGHIARGGSLENDIAEGMVPGKRSRGRPAVKWSDDLRMTVADGSFANAKRDWRSSKMAQHPYHSNPTGLTMIMMMVMMRLRVLTVLYTVLVDLRLDYVAAPCQEGWTGCVGSQVSSVEQVLLKCYVDYRVNRILIMIIY